MGPESVLSAHGGSPMFMGMLGLVVFAIAGLVAGAAVGAFASMKIGPGRAERAMRGELDATNARWRSLVVNASDLVVVIEADGIIKYATPAVERLFGYSLESTVGMQVLDLIHPDDLTFVLDRLATALERPGPGELIEFRILRSDGSYTWVESIGSNLLDEPAVSGIVCNVRDISDRKATENVLLYQARHDQLTGLPNRLELADVIAARSGRAGDQYALLLMDLDRFKEINDGLGHETGDQVLTEVARRLIDGTRATDTVVRLGGDEFAIVVGNLRTADDASQVAQHVLRLLDQPIEIEGMVLHVGASIGIAIAGQADDGDSGGPDPSGLLQRADVAMYRAKELGLGWAIFGVEDESNRPARLALLSDLRQALDAGKLEVHYQPQVEMATGAVRQIEALARWSRNGQYVPPITFIALAEQTGLIRPLTEFVLRQALLQCRRWSDEGMPVNVSVNIAAPSLRDPSLVSLVTAALEEADVPPRQLTLEITESALADHTEAVIAVMARLRAIGVRLSIDDFGSGYSSMAYLKSLPIDELKIDKAFILDLVTDRRDGPITRAIVALGHSLGLTVVGEGVESEDIAAMLRQYGCDVAQGYGICRPQDGATITGWLATRAAATPVGAAIASELAALNETEIR